MHSSARPLTLVVAAIALTGLVVLAGVLALAVDRSPSAEGEDAPAVSPSITLADLDTSTLVVRRESFCATVAPQSVVAALDAEPQRETAHAPGDRAELAEGVRDVAHEHGCSWTGGDATARAWVFAPPVAPGQARAAATSARKVEGCSPLPDAPSYGVASVGLACRTDRGLEISWRGLFGDAWLTCSLRDRDAPREELVDRAGRWCAAVALATSA
ncbi:hypothetical protein GHK92_03150 [Nocardioides sp. dk4132]|uniref:hypothetical protein n=1 Tax=unclassified Nocardioides TaxID=2615069 RepID=UPI001296F3FD|nr:MULTISPECIES: hypothetical protein [unclassified Nocardioides]MQW74859.1 hypothetical protein [Nocardioides sp. dk4132]QGA06746.1 hypothetical protein GFH29_04590 [Nocardioides sp. dk884]